MSVFKQLRHRRRGKEEALLDREIDTIERVMEDEAYQNTFLAPEVAVRVAEGDGVEQLNGATGEFGFDPQNPIPVNGPLGAITYLSRLKTVLGERLLFQRIGGDLDVQAYEAVTYSGDDWFILFLDIYHPRKSTLLPVGFELSGDVALFSGFVDASSDFPKDYTHRVNGLDPRLQPAYAPETRLGGHFGSGDYNRPVGHWAKLEALATRGFI